MSGISKIGQLNAAAVARDVLEVLPKLRTLVAIGVFEDGSATIWASETPDETEKCAIILHASVCEAWNGRSE
jgi:hypothetical protein